MARTCDAIVVGAGIAGLAVGAELARTRSVVVLEMQGAPATQSSARSASSWIARYSGSPVQALTLASRAWYESGGGGHVEHSLLRRRGLLLATDALVSPGLAAALAGGMERLGPDEVGSAYPPLRPGVIVAAAYDCDAQDIDTPAAIEAFRSTLVRSGGILLTGAPATRIERAGNAWRVRTPAATYAAALVVDAAGAWADDVARMASLPPIGLRACRRTACRFESQAGVDPDALPLLMDADERFYVKPESSAFLASPADETEQAAGPAEPRDEDIRAGLERTRAWTTLDPGPPTARWAGLRTFASDRVPVLGLDPMADGFAWYAGVGGAGIMTAPAAARSVVSLIDDGRLPEDVAAAGGDAARVLPDRLRLVASEPP